jgi:hypothetical protein
MKNLLVISAVLSLLFMMMSPIQAQEPACDTWDFTASNGGFSSSNGEYVLLQGWYDTAGSLDVSGAISPTLSYYSGGKLYLDRTNRIINASLDLDGVNVASVSGITSTTIDFGFDNVYSPAAIQFHTSATYGLSYAIRKLELCNYSDASPTPTPTPTNTPTPTVTPIPTDVPTSTPAPTASPGDEGGWVGITEVITVPYTFEAIDLNNSAPQLPLPDLLNVTFINQIGSIALTLMALFDQYQVLGIFVILLVAMLVTFWLWTFVTGTPSQVTLKATDAIDVAGEVLDVQNDYLEEDMSYYQANARKLNQVDPQSHNRYLMAKGQYDQNKRAAGGLTQGAKLFRRAKKDFGGNPFK